MKKLIPALCLLLISAILMGTSTYAWFSMNTTVTATGMKVQAKAEGGLLISATAAADSWSNSASITLGKDVIMLPASTANGDAWYHAHSTSSSSATSAGYYALSTSGTDAEPTDATLAHAGTIVVANENLYSSGLSYATVFYDDNNGNSTYNAGNDDGFYLLTKYFIKSSGDAITINPSSGTYKALAINAVSVGTITGSAQLDKSLRIGVQLYDEENTKVGNFVVLAPVSGADGATATVSGTKIQTTPVSGGTDVAALIGLCSNSVDNYYANADTAFGKSAADDVPSFLSGKYLTAYIYVWFEGEDATCISDNITASLDELNISVSFKLTSVTGQFNDTATTAEPTT